MPLNIRLLGSSTAPAKRANLTIPRQPGDQPSGMAVQNLGEGMATTVLREVIGIDFSGAATDKNTWAAKAQLSGDGLMLTECRPISRSDLALLLESRDPGTVAALDFPFSVPEGFAGYWVPRAGSMPSLWAAAAAMDYREFLALRDAFVATHGEPKRLCDLEFPECYSCLHKANPNMVPMTFRGMQMLHQLWSAGCEVPPLAPQNRNKPLLLEAMPGAALRAFGLPFKGYKNGIRAYELRRQILDGLAQQASLPLPNLKDFDGLCLSSHDCLDAVVAAVVAALWIRNQDLFWRPSEDERDAQSSLAKLEGWLYAPVNIKS